MSRRNSLQVALVVCGAAIFSNCLCSPIGPLDSTVPATCRNNAALVVPQATDILFVIDNSPSMAANQVSVANELPTFVAALAQGAGVTNDFQVGVITTS